MKKTAMTFNSLVESIRQVHDHLAAQAGRAVNMSLTLRNWAIGFYIEGYERSGIDRAAYGERLMDDLSKRLQDHGLSRCDRRELYRYRQFYSKYPQIVDAVTPQLMKQLRIGPIGQTLSAKSNASNVDSTAPQLKTDGKALLSKLSFTHFVELINIEDGLKRAFYEIESIRGNWSVRELKRQINSLYYERSGLSKDKKKLAELVKSGVETSDPKLNIRDPYIFEFLGLKPKEEIVGSAAFRAIMSNATRNSSQAERATA